MDAMGKSRKLVWRGPKEAIKHSIQNLSSLNMMLELGTRIGHISELEESGQVGIVNPFIITFNFEIRNRHLPHGSDVIMMERYLQKTISQIGKGPVKYIHNVTCSISYRFY